MENSLLVIFDEIWPKTMYYSIGTLARFLSNFKKFIKNPILIRISSNFLHNISTCICIRKFNKNVEFSPSHVLMKFGQRSCTIVQGLWPDF